MPSPVRYKVSVTIGSANDLPKGMIIKTLPLLAVTINGEEQRTKPHKSHKNPIWNKRFNWVFDTKPTSISYQVVESDWLVGEERMRRMSLTNKLLPISALGKKGTETGACVQDITAYFDDGRAAKEESLALTKKKKDHEKPAGMLNVTVVCVEEKRTKLESSAVSHVIQVKVLEARGLDSSIFDAGDPYTQITFDGERYQTRVKEGTQPTFNEYVVLWAALDSHDGKQELLFSVKDKDYLTADDRLGYAPITVQAVQDDAARYQEGVWLQLQKKIARKDTELESKKSSEYKEDASKGELRVAIKIIPLAELEETVFGAMLDELDVDGDGNLSKPEMAAILEMLRTEEVSQQQLDDVFETIDANADGQISKEEFRAFLQSSHAQQLVGVKRLLLHYEQSLNTNSDCMSVCIMNDVPRKREGLQVKDFETGRIVDENIPIYITAALKVMSSNIIGRWGTEKAMKLCQHMSVNQGRKYNKPSSVSAIEPFIALHSLKEAEFKVPKEEYKCFNDFFARELAEGARVVDTPQDSTRVASPADCRMMLFADVEEATELWIKGKEFTFGRLLGDDPRYVSKFERGSMAICRLAPQDYHRWHLPVAGVLGETRLVGGALYTVNPIAVNQNVNVFTENKRTLCPIETEHFGTVMLIAVGAVMVGSMVIPGQVGDAVSKGDYHGHFLFGGSTVILLFEPGKVKWFEEIYKESRRGMEVLVKCGQHIAELGEGSPAAAAPPAPQS